MSVPALDSLTWPVARLADAVQALARHYGKDGAEVPRAPGDLLLGSAVEHWMVGAATAVGLEAVAVSISLLGLESALLRARCLLLPHRRGYLVVLRGGSHKVTLLDGNLSPRRVSRRALARELRRQRVAALAAEGNTRTLLSILNLPEAETARVERVVSELSPDAELASCWLFQLAPGEPYHRQLLRAGLPRGFAVALLLGLLQASLSAVSWLVFGVAALNGRLDPARLVAWALVLLGSIPLQLGGSWLIGELALRVGLSFKRRLFDGALRVSVDATRRDGVGALLGRVNEAGAVEALLIIGGLGALSAAADWLVAAVLLARTAYPAPSLILFVLLSLMLLLMALDLMQKERRWMLARIRLAGDFVERMLGYRTRVMQESRDHWHDGEDRQLESYLGSSRKLDERQVALGMLPRLLPVLGIALIVPLMIAPAVGGLGNVLLTLIGVTTAASALNRLWGLLGLFVSAALAWRSTSQFFQASVLDPPTPHLYFHDAVAQTRAGSDVLLEARDLTFRYPNRPRPALSGCSLKIERGDRILIRGASGGGKSTFGAILSGVRVADSGLLLVRGLDRHVLTTEQWRGTVASVPQFHENHVFTNSLAFNLLLGRGWPASPRDLDDAREVCEELGLGPLIGRMPGGLFEAIGEAGWQLSHGEKSRVYIARALLQRADVTILDESLGALDPETLAAVIPCVLKRAGTLVVLAHL
jgi:ATP-binding cassette, subfamily B, bacterial